MCAKLCFMCRYSLGHRRAYLHEKWNVKKDCFISVGDLCKLNKESNDELSC